MEEATKTMYITLLYPNTKKIVENLLYNNFNVCFVIEKKKGKLICDVKCDSNKIKIGEKYDVTILLTNDPTPENAIDVASMGYYSLRWLMENAELIKKDRLTFIGKPQFNLKNSLPLQEPI